MTRPVSLANHFWFSPNVELTLNGKTHPGVALFLTSAALVLSSIHKLRPSAPNTRAGPVHPAPRAA